MKGDYWYRKSGPAAFGYTPGDISGTAISQYFVAFYTDIMLTGLGYFLLRL